MFYVGKRSNRYTEFMFLIFVFTDIVYIRMYVLYVYDRYVCTYIWYVCMYVPMYVRYVRMYVYMCVPIWCQPIARNRLSHPAE